MPPPESYDITLEDQESLDLLQYWRTILRHKWGIISITLMAVIIGTLLALSATPIYKAKTVLLADPIQPNVNTHDNYVNTALVYLFYETQYEIIRSRTVAEKVVEKLELVKKSKQEQENKAAMNSKGSFQRIKESINLSQWLPDILLPKPDPEQDDEKLFRALVSSIQGGLEVKGGKQSEIIDISYESVDPQRAADVVNAVANAYIDFGLNSRLNGVKKTASWLNEQLSELKDNLNKSEEALESFQRNQGLVDSDHQQQIASTQLSTLNAELIKAQTKRSEAEILYNQVKTLKDSNDNFDSLGPVLNNETVRRMAQEEAGFSRKVKELSKRYGEKHPNMIAAQSDLKQAKLALQREIEKVVNNISKQYKLAVAQERKIASIIREQKSEIGNLKGINFELTRLEREVENNRRIYENFLSQFQEADVSEDYDASNVRVIDPANVPITPHKPNKPRRIITSGLIGLFLGIALAFLRESLDNTFKSTETIEEKLNIPSLGLVPFAEKSSPPEKQYLSDPHSSFAEHINNIRTGLLFTNIDQPPQVIMITSANGSEGKSTLAINLAASLGQLDRTLLLEADLRKPTISLSLQIDPATGLSDLLCNRCQSKDVAFSKIGGDETNLYMVSCGILAHNPLDLLSSKEFIVFLEQLRSRFKYIVVDAPPLLAVSDAIIVGQMSDSVVLMVKAESTTVKMAREALNRLYKGNIQVTGSVLTHAIPHRMSYYGNYNYHTSSYYGYKSPKANEAA
jgi:capsular exopolysaccharide synthesis family protein